MANLKDRVLIKDWKNFLEKGPFDVITVSSGGACLATSEGLGYSLVEYMSGDGVFSVGTLNQMGGSEDFDFNLDFKDYNHDVDHYYLMKYLVQEFELNNLNEGDSFSIDKNGAIHRHSQVPNDSLDKEQED